MTNLYELGDVTQAFRQIAKKTAKTLDALPIKILYERQAFKPDPKLSQFISQPTEVNLYSIELDGERVADNLEMPRDVFHVLTGIGIGRGIY